MVSSLFRKIFGSRNERLVKRMRRVVETINVLEPEMEALSDSELRAKTDEFRSRLEAGESLDDLTNEAFATVREASRRVMGMRHFDVQLIGGMVLHQGKIAEMRTGEGKTLMATLPTYLNALSGRGVHIVTVNDYLARRDAHWMAPLYEFLGLSVGVVVPGMEQAEKRDAYRADITYGTNNEFGFDYLRDNMAFSLEDKVQREHSFAVVDEVDSILIDEARTPLIISGAAEDSSELYQRVNGLVPMLIRQEATEGEESEEAEGDFTVDEKSKQIHLSENGHQHVEEMLTSSGLLPEGQSLYDASNLTLLHHFNAALRAHHLYQRDVDYIVKDNQIVIVDEFTGRTLAGRRWSEGLHQAVEAKEGVLIQNENQTLASITFQNYFRIYDKLAGMTGTADTEAFEFQQIYGLETVVIPTNQAMVREDLVDQVYMTAGEKYNAIIEDVRSCQKRGQPALVGTASIEVSEKIAELLTREGIKHEVLNAKQHEREADIVAQAGSPGAVTIATNMAGRGTDIVLGGNLEVALEALGEDASEQQRENLRDEWKEAHAKVLEAGGLHIIGTERHESRRIDNQLRGRSGRQGDPGSSRFYLSLEDSLMRIFASGKVGALMSKLGMEDGEAIEHPWVSRAIENAQRKVEAHNFDIRKNLLEFDDVANDQRKVIYEQRNELLAEEDVQETVEGIIDDVLEEMISSYVPLQSLEEQWDVPGLEESIDSQFGIKLDISGWLSEDESLHEESLRQRVHQEIAALYAEKEQFASAEVMRHFEREVMLRVLDTHWKEHLVAMDYLRQGIHLRGFAQKNPKQEYKREAFEMFGQMLEMIKREVARVVLRVQVRTEDDVEAVEEQRRSNVQMTYQHADAPSMGGDEPVADQEPKSAAPYTRDERKVGRNEPCPCGSGKKYKQCHGRLS